MAAPHLALWPTAGLRGAQPGRALHSAERGLPACTDGSREEDICISPDHPACNHVSVGSVLCHTATVCLEQSKLRRAIGVTRPLGVEDPV